MNYDPADAPLMPFGAAVSSFREGTSSPRDFLERCLAAIDGGEPALRAFVTLNVTDARAAADRSSTRYREGRPRSPIDGMPVGIKDVIETRDMPTQMGSPLFDGWQSTGDAACVGALREAGAVVLAKTVTCEFAAIHPGPTRNPHDAGRSPGGSSSGSAAAVGGGMVPACLGTQALGSIIRPASYCGAYGFKPTLGAINRHGCHDYVSQSCVGAIGASLSDCWQVLATIADRVGGDAGYPGLSGASAPVEAVKPARMIRLETAGWEDADDEARASFERALATIAAGGTEVLSRAGSAVVEEFEAAIAEATPLTRKINGWEYRWPLARFREQGAEHVSAAMLQRLEAAEAMVPGEYAAAIEECARLRARYGDLANHADFCVLLGATGPAPEGIDATGNPNVNVPASLLGAPAVALPVLSARGLPLGLQLMGFPHRDAALIGFAAWVEQRLLN
jgi:Asp-tRNA(Asn)/Glu-tRNA(Gln) amidotransferase A subunit family amidase